LQFSITKLPTFKTATPYSPTPVIEFPLQFKVTSLISVMVIQASGLASFVRLELRVYVPAERIVVPHSDMTLCAAVGEVVAGGRGPEFAFVLEECVLEEAQAERKSEPANGIMSTTEGAFRFTGDLP
jgi:hypothetical protein